MQGLIARGYPDLAAARYALLQIGDAARARGWLGRVSSQVTPAPARPADFAMNLALSADGFRKLGLAAASMKLFSNEFIAGMTTPHRRRLLGDTGPNAPETWLW